MWKQSLNLMLLPWVLRGSFLMRDLAAPFHSPLVALHGWSLPTHCRGKHKKNHELWKKICHNQGATYKHMCQITQGKTKSDLGKHFEKTKKSSCPKWASKQLFKWTSAIPHHNSFMPRLHLPVKPSCNTKSHIRQFLQNASGTWLSCSSYGVYVAITGCTWQLRGLCDEKKFFLRFIKLSVSASYVDPSQRRIATSHSISKKIILHRFTAWLYMKVWPWHYNTN